MPDNVASIGHLRILGCEASVGRISFPADNSPDARKLASIGRGLPRQPPLASVGQRPPRQPSLASVGRTPLRQPPLASVGRRPLRQPHRSLDIQEPPIFPKILCNCCFTNEKAEMWFYLQNQDFVCNYHQKTIFDRNPEMISRSLRSCW